MCDDLNSLQIEINNIGGGGETEDRREDCTRG